MKQVSRAGEILAAALIHAGPAHMSAVNIITSSFGRVSALGRYSATAPIKPGGMSSSVPSSTDDVPSENTTEADTSFYYMDLYETP
eukprot:gene26568-32618_t